MNILTGPTQATIKRLFALSGNRCAFPKCASTLVDGKKVVGKICHIKARNESGPRFDPNQTPEERHGYDNLILMCGRHHDVIDDDEEAYTVEHLHWLKAKHEQRTEKLSEDDAEQGAELLLSDQYISSINQSGGVTAHTINIQNNITAPQLTVGPVSSGSIVDVQPFTRVEATTSPKLKITRRTERLIFEHLKSRWRFAQQWEPESQNALVLWVENEFPVQGNGKDLTGLIASIRAEQYDSMVVSRAYWLEQLYNQVTLASGDRLGVFVGCFSSQTGFFSYSNPYPEPSLDVIVGDGFRPLGKKTEMKLAVRESGTMPLRITITIAQMPAQNVLACNQLTITLPQRVVDMQECE